MLQVHGWLAPNQMHEPGALIETIPLVVCVASGETKRAQPPTAWPKRGARGSAATAHWIFSLCGFLARLSWKEPLLKLPRRHGEIRRGGGGGFFIATVVFCGC